MQNLFRTGGVSRKGARTTVRCGIDAVIPKSGGLTCDHRGLQVVLWGKWPPVISTGSNQLSLKRL
ncbi:MAG: hypothetical protein GTN65_05875 [Armatimonadetes bacterium]|nr:hypothetical protein [Armatimonadota bacterium]NIM23369.1 hypothetical protein [Armatimonadota bacterium]NIN05417.1 hypothetical protein [Armatimonadota bacterium]NIO96621.1 hypothetical protein [Armatimonadota bacterium]NIT30777.1 hypothetical protein [Armatimonadota bacterium]